MPNLHGPARPPSDAANSSLFAQAAWDQGYRDAGYEFGSVDEAVGGWLDAQVSGLGPIAAGATCLEVGCYPGRYLALLGKRGFELHGIDLTPRTSEMAKWLRSEGLKTGEFSNTDFLKWDDPRQYDVVMSNGFIEHFENWADVLREHARRVRPGGVLLLTVPNFSGGFQNWFHRSFDDVNLGRHYLPAMDRSAWAAVLESEGLEILISEPFGPFDFWIGEQRRSLGKKLGFAALRAALPVLRRLVPAGRESTAPYFGMSARKRRI